MNVATIGVDTAKSIFHVIEKNKHGRVLNKIRLKRHQISAYFSNIPPTKVAMEACGASHYWCRVISQHGHEVIAIPPQYVIPYRKGNKNDFNDAEAIAEAAQRDDVRTVPVKTIEQQDIQLIHRVRQRLINQRTALSNQIRGLLAEYGIVIPKGIHHVRKNLPFILEDAENELTHLVRKLFNRLHEELRAIDDRIEEIDRDISSIVKDSPVCQRLMTMPGIGPIIATTIFSAIGLGKDFKNGRHFAAWCGVVPRQHTTGDKPQLLGISKRGNTYLRTQLINGARSALIMTDKKDDPVSSWANALKKRAHFNTACVALANKMARMAWAMLHNGENYLVK